MKNPTKEELLKQRAEIDKKLTDLEEKGKKGYVIKNRFNNAEIYVSKADNVKDAVIEAVKGRVSLREANLREANLWGADLREANLGRANLWEANLREANLWGADLRGADLREADLREAKFYGKGGNQKLKKNQVEDFLKALGFEIKE